MGVRTGWDTEGQRNLPEERRGPSPPLHLVLAGLPVSDVRGPASRVAPRRRLTGKQQTRGRPCSLRHTCV